METCCRYLVYIAPDLSIGVIAENDPFVIQSKRVCTKQLSKIKQLLECGDRPLYVYINDINLNSSNQDSRYIGTLLFDEESCESSLKGTFLVDGVFSLSEANHFKNLLSYKMYYPQFERF